MIHTQTLKVMSAVDMSVATSNGLSVLAFNIALCSFQAVWTGTSPVGTLQIQGSNNNINWSNDGSTTAVSGNSGNVLIKVTSVCYDYIRIQYAKTSGVGTLNVLQSCQGEGALGT